jgi:hypothetical protein
MIKKRISESTAKPKIVEYLQGGILVRFDIQQKTKDTETFFQCTEYWFEKTVTISQIETEVLKSGFNLIQEHKNLIV